MDMMGSESQSHSRSLWLWISFRPPLLILALVSVLSTPCTLPTVEKPFPRKERLVDILMNQAMLLIMYRGELGESMFCVMSEILQTGPRDY